MDPVPVYRQVADDLRDKINHGAYAPGQPLPGERALAETYGIARPTLRQALSLLRTEGVLVSEHGRGVYVRQAPTVQRLARNRLSRAARDADQGAFLGDAAAGGFAPSSAVRVYFEPATPATAESLGIAAGDEVTVRDRVMRADGVAVQLAVSRLPRSITTGTAMEQVDTGPGGIYARLEDAGHTLDHFTETVGARAPTTDEARTLGIATPVITVTRVAHSATGPVEINHMVMAAERYELVYELPAT